MKIISNKKWNEQQTQIENLMAECVTSHSTILKLKEEIINLKHELENHPKRDSSTGKFTKRK